MKKVYKMIAITVFGFAMILAQDSIAQRGGNGSATSKGRGNDRGEVLDHKRPKTQDNFKRERRNNQRGRGKGQRNLSYHDIKIRFWGQPYQLGRVYVHHGRMYAMKKGLFYIKRHHRWIPVQAPYGLQVAFIPHGSQMVYSRRGILLHEFRGTFYQELRGRGAVVVAPPRRPRNGHRRW